MFRGLGVGLAACWLLGGVLAAPAGAFTGSYTGSPLNLALPDDDSFDWGDAIRFNFTTINSSFSSIGTSTGSLASSITTLSASTAAVAARVTTLETWQSTAAPKVTASETWQSTITPHIALLNTSTASLAASAAVLETWQSSMTPHVSQLNASTEVFRSWQSTMTPHVAQLNTSTASLQVALDTKLTSAAIPSGFVDLSTVTTALAGKLSNTAAIDPVLVDLSTIATALAGKLDDGVAVPGSLLDLSTYTFGGGGETFVAATTSTYPTGTATQTTFLLCQANSTGTWTQNNAGRALISFAGSLSSNSGGIWVSVNVMLDGAFLPGYSATLGINANAYEGVNLNPQYNSSFSILTPVLTAAEHTVCLSIATSGGTITIPGVQGKTTTAQLSVIELATGNN